MKNPLLSILLLTSLFLSACGASEADILATVAVAETNAVGTVHAQYTEWALLTPSATNTQPPTSTPMVTNTPAVIATATTSLGGGATGGCDVMTFVSDVTIPDGEQIAAGTAFTKTWRLRNDGTCTWEITYTIIFSSGDQMGGPSSQTLTATVAPGASVDVSVELVAPATPGDYSSYWAIANAGGQAFGYFYVEIEVV